MLCDCFRWMAQGLSYTYMCIHDGTGTQLHIYVYPFSPWLSGKESACQCRKLGFDPCVGEVPWRRKWQPIPVFLLGKSHGQRSLVGCSPWGRKKSDTTEMTEHTCMHSSPKLPSHPGCHITLSKFPVLYRRSLLVFHFKYSIVYMSIPNSLTIPSFHPSPLTLS